MHCVRRNQRKQTKVTSRNGNISGHIKDSNAEDYNSLSTSSEIRRTVISGNIRRNDIVPEMSAENGACRSASTTESNESGILEDIGESIDDFIDELDNLEWSLSHDKNKGNQNSAKSVDISTLFERMKCTIDEETKQSQEFIDSVKTWRHSDDVKIAKTFSKEEEEERARREWFIKMCSRRLVPEKASLSVSERLKKRKERLRGNDT